MYILFTTKQARLTDNTSELGLCVLLYAAKLVQSAEDVVTKTGICKLLHEMIKINEDRSCLKQLQKDVTSLMLVLSEKYSSEHFIDSLVQVYSTQLTTIQMILVILVNKIPLQPKILLILIGSKLKKNLLLQDLLTQLQTHLSAPIKMVSLQYMMQNIIPDQSQITHQIFLVKIVTIKNKFDKMVMSVKNNLQRMAQKKIVNMKTVCVKVFHL